MKTLLAPIFVQLIFAAQLWSQTPTPAPSADRIVVETTSSRAKLFPYISGMKFRQAIIRAGGLVDFSNSNKFFLIRGGKKEDIKLKDLENDPSKEPVLEPWDVICRPVLGDCIVLAESDRAEMVPYAPNPVVPYAPSMKFSEAIAEGDSFVEFAKILALFLIRDGKKELIKLKALKTDSSKEPMLQPWDIIYLPPSMFD